MNEVYSAHGVHFEFPDRWELAEESTGSDVFVTVSSPETSFWSLTLFRDRPSPQQVLTEAVEAYQDEYEELDAYPGEGTLAGRRGLSCDLEFVCLEMINSAFLRVCRTDEFTALVLYQGTDHELNDTRPLLEQITKTLTFEPSEEHEDD